MKFKILCWNIWVYGDIDKVADFLKQAEADIIGLQEVEADNPERDIISRLSSLGYEYVFEPVEKGKDENVLRDGPAIFSKYPIKHNETYILSEKEARAAVRADIEVDGKMLHVFCTHLLHTHQQDWEVQIRQAENLMSRLTEENTVVMGDFNATPESQIISKMQEVL